MAKSFTVNRTGASTVNAGTTRYSTLGGHLTMGTTESLTQFSLGVAATFSELGVTVSAYTLSAGATFHFAKGGTSQFSVSITGTGVFSTASTAACAVGDLLSFQSVAAAGTGSITYRTTIIHHETSGADVDKCLTLLHARGVATVTADNSNFYAPPNGYVDGFDTTELGRKVPIRFVNRIKRLHAIPSANTRNPVGTTEVHVNVGGSSSTQNLQIAGLSTTLTIDTTNTDLVAADTEVSFKVTTDDAGGLGDGNPISFALIGATMYSLVGEFAMISAQASSGVALTFGTQHYLAVAGRLFSETASEDRAKVLPKFSLRVRALECYVSANTLNTNRSKLSVLDGGVAGYTVAGVADTTGLKSDLTNSDGIVGGVDTLTLGYDTTMDGSGSASIFWTSLVGNIGKSPVLQRHRAQRALLVR